MKNPSTKRIVVIACLLLAGCEKFREDERRVIDWHTQCAEKGGVVYHGGAGSSAICLKKETVIQ